MPVAVGGGVTNKDRALPHLRVVQYTVHRNTRQEIEAMGTNTAIPGMRKAHQRPPNHLRKATKAFWKAVNESYVLDDHHRRLLTAACEAWDRMEQAREAIAEDGAYFVDRHGNHKAHAAVQVERDSRIGFARLIRELQLDADVTPDNRPPHLTAYGAR